jgi:YD repeat-containing protein
MRYCIKFFKSQGLVQVWLTLLLFLPVDLTVLAAGFAYDSSDRLTRVTHPDGTTIDYVYDALGNRLMKTTTLAGAASNQPPAAVTNPSISNGVTNVATAATLSWSAAVDPHSGDSMVYVIYFGTLPTPLSGCRGWPKNLSSGKLGGWTTYCWRAAARGSHRAWNSQTEC